MRIKPKKSLGQNFLIDGNIRRKIISACAFSSQDIVLEIGSGRGELTRLVAEKVKKIFALEIDSRLIELLKNNLSGCKNSEVIHGDFLKFDLEGFLHKTKTKIKILGNIPYYITTPIIERCLEQKNKIEDIFITVQKEFAERVIAVPGSKKFGSLSCFIQYYTLPEILFTIKKNSFFPVPKVDSSFLRLSILEAPSVTVEDEERFFKIIRAAFNKRRKTLKNSLKGTVPEEKLKQFFKEFKIDPLIRPECLSLQHFAALSKL